jgi:hypothetical protein
MDARHFDALTRTLAETGTRRGLFGLLAGLPLIGGLLSRLDPIEADAQGRRRRRRRKARHHPGDDKDQRNGQRKGRHKKPHHGQDDGGNLGSGGPCLAAGTDLQAAIDAASPGATLTLCAGAFDGDVSIARDLTLMGAGAGVTVVQRSDADGGSLTGGIIAVDSGASVTVQDLTIAKANGDRGWGIANAGTLRLVGVEVFPPFGGVTVSPLQGSGIYNEGTLTLAPGSSVVRHVGLSDGAGIYNSAGTVTLEADSEVSGNFALGKGGGIYNAAGTLVVKSGSRVRDNVSRGAGGGIFNGGGTVTVEASSSVTDNGPNNCAPTDTIANCLE